ncbi:hypothetical protein ScPMuIL_017189 [Solemya velum]
MLPMYVKIVVVSLAVILLQHVVRLLLLMDFGVTIFNHTPGPCKIVPGIDFGSEDMETMPDGLTLLPR